MKPFTTRVLGFALSVFRRTLGVKPHMFFQMRAVLEQREVNKTKQGRILVLELDHQLVLTFQFWREYRTRHHLSLDWEVGESTVRRTIERVENAMIKSLLQFIPAPAYLHLLEIRSVGIAVLVSRSLRKKCNQVVGELDRVFKHQEVVALLFF
jgi:hypothetical protein